MNQFTDQMHSWPVSKDPGFTYYHKNEREN